MQFIDEAVIQLKAGDGGKGCLSFRREKFVPRGGPDGGNGGRGGHIIVEGYGGLTTLMDLKYRQSFRAENGEHGRGSDQQGREGEDLVIKVPVGTLIYDNQTNELIEDIIQSGQRVIVAEGGRAGRGNAVFKSSVTQAPRRVEPGQPGQEREIRLELKLLADVGLIGLPNAGKSTLLSVISKARPKIADYPFTTLSPVLGMVSHQHYPPFTVADIPGLIEGAHRGQGLGHQFLRHIERTRVFLHIVSLGPDEPQSVEERFNLIQREILQYDPNFKDRSLIVVLTKRDLVPEIKDLASVRAPLIKRGYPVVVISAATLDGVDELLDQVGRILGRDAQDNQQATETDSD